MNHAEARSIIEDAFQRVHGRLPTDLEALYCQAVAWLETMYARAPGQHARWASDGLFTWGNIEKAGGSCEPPWFPGSDAGNARCFLLRNSDVEAAVDLVKNLTKRHWPVLQAIRDEGTPEAVAHAMKASPAYYEAPESTYAAGLRAAVKTITGGGSVPGIPKKGFPWLPVLGVAAALGGIAYVAVYRKDWVAELKRLPANIDFHELASRVR